MIDTVACPVQAVKQYRPFWRYIHQDGEKHPRPQHEAWNGLILHADNPWWGAHYPPGGWGCKCSVETLAQRDLDRLGRSPDSAPPTDMRTVTIGKNGPSSRIVDTPAGIDPGFGHIQGKTSLGATAERFIEKSAGLPAPVAAQAVLDATSRQRVIDGLSGEFSSWLSQISKGENDYFAVGALSPDLVDSMAAHGHPPETAAIIVRDAEALHVMRDSKVKRLTASGLPKALTVDQFGDLPRLLANPRAVLLDKKRSSLLYVFDPPTRSAGKIVVAVNFRGKLSGAGKSTFNAVQTASLTEIKNLQNEVESGDVVILQGKL